MKILQLGKFYPIRGGVEKVMHDLMIGLSETGVRCDMLCASAEHYAPGTYTINSFAQLIVVPTTRKVAATMLAPAMIRKLRNIAQQYDIIHIHHPDPMAALALFLSGYKGKVILHWHSDILKQKLLLKLYKPLQNWLIKRADQIVGTTPVYVQQSPFLLHVQNKIDYIPIGVAPIDVSENRVRMIREMYPDKKIVFSLGRLVEYKGYEYLIAAFAKLNEDYVLLIGGTGPLKATLDDLIESHNLQQRVFLLGFVADEAIPDYYGACDLFCLSSIWKTEAFAIVQIEAMSCGKAVVSTHIPESGVSWVNRDRVSGLVVPKEDSTALAHAIKTLGTAEAFRRQLEEGAKARYLQEFTLDVMVRKALLLYKRLLGYSDSATKKDF